MSNNDVLLTRIGNVNFRTSRVRLPFASFILAGLFTLAISPASAQEANDISFDDLVFEMKKTDNFDRSMLTDEIVALHKQTIRLRGFIRPTERQNNITKFIFVRDNKECCFGPGAALYDCMLVKLAKGEATEYTTFPITLRGQLLLSEFEGPDGKVWAIYRLKNAVVE